MYPIKEIVVKSEQRDRLFLAIVITLFSLLLIWLASGCSGTKQVQELKDEFVKVSKRQEEMNLKLAGNNNVLTKIDKTTESTHNESVKIAKEQSKSSETTAKEIGKLIQKWETTNNSTILMIVLFGMLCLTLGGLLFFIIKLMANGARLKRAFVDNGNDLTPDKWKAL